MTLKVMHVIQWYNTTGNIPEQNIDANSEHILFGDVYFESEKNKVDDIQALRSVSNNLRGMHNRRYHKP